MAEFSEFLVVVLAPHIRLDDAGEDAFTVFFEKLFIFGSILGGIGAIALAMLIYSITTAPGC